MTKKFTDDELKALPIRPAITNNVVAVTDPVTGHTTMERQPRRYFVSTTDPFIFTDSDGTWMIGLDEDGYFKHGF